LALAALGAFSARIDDTAHTNALADLLGHRALSLETFARRYTQKLKQNKIFDD
jgi:hypothetical protein